MDFFDNKDMWPLVNLNGRAPEFVLEPLADCFSPEIGETTKKIIKALYDREFNVPGFRVRFILKDGNKIEVMSITNIDLDLALSGHSASCKGVKADIFEDGSGSALKYVGDDWERDRKEFLSGRYMHHKMDGKPKILLQYSKQGANFHHTNDCGRAYDPKGLEPRILMKTVIEMRVNAHLKKVLKHILKTPAVDNPTPFVEPEAVPITNPLFVDKIMRGWLDSGFGKADESLIPSRRLLSIGSPKPEDHPFRHIMTEGFVYLELEDVDRPRDTEAYNRYDAHIKCDVVLNKANNVYVIDAGVFQSMKEKWNELFPVDFDHLVHDYNDHYLSDTCVANFKMAQAETMVPINEYEGGYEKPIVITTRRIFKDEITAVHQPQEA